MTLHASLSNLETSSLPVQLLRTEFTKLQATPRGRRAETVLIVDELSQRRRNAMDALDGGALDFLTCETAERALNVINTQPIDLVLLDLMAPKMGSSAFCRNLRGSRTAPLTPVIVLAREGNQDEEFSAMEAGADAVLPSGANARALRAAVNGCLKRKAVMDQLDETEVVLFTLAKSVEERDPGLGLHCERLALMAGAMGVALGLESDEVVTLQRGGYLHDVGKIGIPDSILFKPGPLTDEEWVIMKSHPERGERICSGVRSLASVLPIIRHHHERWDGNGYPDKLKGDEIPLSARIIQFADIYDALTAHRPYKRAFTSDEAVKIMQEETRKGWRDPHLMQVFCDLLPVFHATDGMDFSRTSLKALGNALERYRTHPEPLKLVG